MASPERLPDCVPQEMFALWLHQEDLTPEEEVQYDNARVGRIGPNQVSSLVLLLTG